MEQVQNILEHIGACTAQAAALRERTVQVRVPETSTEQHFDILR